MIGGRWVNQSNSLGITYVLVSWGKRNYGILLLFNFLLVLCSFSLPLVQCRFAYCWVRMSGFYNLIPWLIAWLAGE